MRIGRTLTPAAAPIPLKILLKALPACFEPQNQSDGIFEEELKAYFGVKYCFLLSSGKAALTLTLSALKEIYPERDEVVIPAFTCFSVPASIIKAGLQIKLCDLAPSSLDLDEKQLQKIMAADRSRRKILCVLATHLFGCPSNLARIREVVGQGIPIVEDAAQAMGEDLKTRKIGTIGDAGFFSLGRGKALSTMEGGVIITSRVDLGEKLASLTDNLQGYSTIAAFNLATKAVIANILQKPSLFWLAKGLPFLRLGETMYDDDFSILKISVLQRRLASKWRERLREHQKARSANCDYWLKGVPNDLYPPHNGCIVGGLIRFPLLARTSEIRDCLIFLGEKKGLGIMPAYPVTVNEIPEIATGFIGQRYPNAKKICSCLLTIPVHQLVHANDNECIFQLLGSAINLDRC